LRKGRDEKRGAEDEVRLSKDKLLHLEIDMKRVQMEKELLEKEKNNEINRLNGLLKVQPTETSSNEVRRLEDDLRNQKHNYEVLLNEFDKYRRNVGDRPREVIREKGNDDQMRMFEVVMEHIREESSKQNRASMDLLKSMVAKMDERNEKQRGVGEEGNKLLEELFNLKHEVT
jgi:GTPase involved in cell partitioning and DNA repair